MKLLLNPDKNGALASIYGKAMREATTLHIASAYLTSWDAAHKVSKTCRQITFLVGTDFGITRKAALRAVLKWLPKDIPSTFGAVSSPSAGFHPKIMAWTTSAGLKYCLVGSSNLSRAAFESNWEANVLVELSKDQYEELVAWLEGIGETAEPITRDWIEHHYVEATPPKPSKGAGNRNGQTPATFVADFGGVRGLDDVVLERRRKQRAFREIAHPLRSAVRASAAGRLPNAAFWDRFWALWANHESRIQGSGLQINCKNANWQEANSALGRILDESVSASMVQLDHFVAQEINGLVAAKNPCHGAWLSEMLCHYVPMQFPVLNSPVRAWLRSVDWRPRRGLAKGQLYVELAQQLRHVLRSKPHGARDLVELDGVIWRYAKERGLA